MFPAIRSPAIHESFKFFRMFFSKVAMFRFPVTRQLRKWSAFSPYLIWMQKEYLPKAIDPSERGSAYTMNRSALPRYSYWQTLFITSVVPAPAMKRSWFLHDQVTSRSSEYRRKVATYSRTFQYSRASLSYDSLSGSASQRSSTLFWILRSPDHPQVLQHALVFLPPSHS